MSNETPELPDVPAGAEPAVEAPAPTCQNCGVALLGPHCYRSASR